MKNICNNSRYEYLPEMSWDQFIQQHSRFSFTQNGKEYITNIMETLKNKNENQK